MIRALVALCAVVGVCAACGRSGGGEANGEAADSDEWVESICTSLTGWRNDLQESTQEIQRSALDLSNPEEAQSLLTTFLEDAVTRTDQLLSEIGEAGAPDVEQGTAISTDLQAALDDGRDVLAEARDGVQELPTDDPIAFVSGAQELAGSVRDGLNDVGQTFDRLNDRYDAPEVEEAIKSSDTCSALR